MRGGGGRFSWSSLARLSTVRVLSLIQSRRAYRKFPPTGLGAVTWGPPCDPCRLGVRGGLCSVCWGWGRRSCCTSTSLGALCDEDGGSARALEWSPLLCRRVGVGGGAVFGSVCLGLKKAGPLKWLPTSPSCLLVLVREIPEKK